MNFKFFAADFFKSNFIRQEWNGTVAKICFNYQELSKIQHTENDWWLYPSTIEGTFSKITKERIEVAKAKWAIVTFYMTTLQWDIAQSVEMVDRSPVRLYSTAMHFLSLFVSVLHARLAVCSLHHTDSRVNKVPIIIVVNAAHHRSFLPYPLTSPQSLGSTGRRIGR